MKNAKQFAVANKPSFLLMISIRYLVNNINFLIIYESLQTTKLGISLKACLDLLKKINSVNREATVQKVNHEQFYIPQLTDKVDVKRDYFKWLVDAPNKVFHIFYYSFYFS